MNNESKKTKRHSINDARKTLAKLVVRNARQRHIARAKDKLEQRKAVETKRKNKSA